MVKTARPGRPGIGSGARVLPFDRRGASAVRPQGPGASSRFVNRAADPGGSGVRHRRGTSRQRRSSRGSPCRPTRDWGTLPAGDRSELRQRNALPAQHLHIRSAVLDQHTRLTLEQIRQPAPLKDAAGESGVQREKNRRTDHRAGDGNVVADDPVLHRIRDQQQDHQIERIRLSQLAFPKQTKRHQQEHVDQDRAQDLLAKTHLQMKDRTPHPNSSRPACARYV